ncbi:MAG: hypothetical protein EZS28_032606 [Streblomastix strix]|uniref:Flagellar FliJ protein n=1 Tax=Streblomastix strix TaxID=222440 RepID=A0A5J4UN63_9EUKA|nr:MAG: hypothetical protein EZS28_032606 [Streblomastix strix]
MRKKIHTKNTKKFLIFSLKQQIGKESQTKRSDLMELKQFNETVLGNIAVSELDGQIVGQQKEIENGRVTLAEANTEKENIQLEERQLLLEYMSTTIGIGKTSTSNWMIKTRSINHTHIQDLQRKIKSIETEAYKTEQEVANASEQQRKLQEIVEGLAESGKHIREKKDAEK